MTNLKKSVLFLNLIFFSFFVLALSSCDSEISVKSLKDGTFSVNSLIFRYVLYNPRVGFLHGFSANFPPLQRV